MMLYHMSKYLLYFILIFHFKRLFAFVEAAGPNKPAATPPSPQSSEEIKEKFDKACKYVESKFEVSPEQGGMKISDDQKLSLYKCYKQANEGDCNTQQPGLLQLRERKKWNAWNEMRGVSKEDAMKAYVENLAKIKQDWEACYDNERAQAKA